MKRRKGELSVTTGNGVGVVIIGNAYSVSARGTLQKSNLETGETYRASEVSAFSGTTHLFATSGGALGTSLFALDADGSLYQVEM